MNAFSVGNRNHGWVLVRAEDRDAAKWMHPEVSPNSFWSMADLQLHVRREPWLDGDGPSRELKVVMRECPYEHTDEEWWCEGMDYHCFEGDTIDKPKTVRANR